MTSPCKKCQFLSTDGDACCFAVMMDVSFVDAKDFEGDLPDECAELAFFKEVVEELEDEGYEQEYKALLEEHRRLVAVLEENLENLEEIKNDQQ